MKFAVIFEDDEAHQDVRPIYMQQHLAFLLRNAAQILAAGPILPSETGARGGGLWVVEADDADHVRKLVEGDPFFSTGLRKEINIFRWKTVFENGEVKL